MKLNQHRKSDVDVNADFRYGDGFQVNSFQPGRLE